MEKRTVMLMVGVRPGQGCFLLLLLLLLLLFLLLPQSVSQSASYIQYSTPTIPSLLSVNLALRGPALAIAIATVLFFNLFLPPNATKEVT